MNSSCFVGDTLGLGDDSSRVLLRRSIESTVGESLTLHGEGCGWHALLNDGILLAET